MRTPPRRGSNVLRLTRKKPELSFVKYTGACKRGYWGGPVPFRCISNMRLSPTQSCHARARQSTARENSGSKGLGRAPGKNTGPGKTPRPRDVVMVDEEEALGRSVIGPESRQQAPDLLDHFRG